MAKRTNHNQRSLEYYRKQGYTCAMVENWCGFTGRRKDLFGIIDMIAIHPEKPGVLGVQICRLKGGTGLSGHRKKVIASEVTPIWTAGNRLVILAWDQPKGKGTKWVAREEEITQ